DFMDCVHHIWCPLFSQEFQDLPDGAETTLTKKLGELHFFSAEFNKNSALTRHHLTWRDSAQQSKSSGALGDLSCHLLDLFCFIGESPVVVHGIKTVKGTRGYKIRWSG
ncbi:hypothetical protein L3W91_18215, partial [Escherichia coli]|nr:hypothetical protein [Escherichia coli]